MGPQRKIPLAAATVLAVLGSLGAAGCVNDLSPVYIDAFFPLSVSESSCSPGNEPISSGVLDTTRNAGYVVGVRIQNVLTSTENPAEGQINAHRAIIDTAHVTYRFADGGAAAPPPARVPLNVSVESTGNATVVFTLLTTEAAQTIAGQEGVLIANVSVSGKLATGGAIRSSALEFPITLCVDCVFSDCEVPGTVGPSGRPALKDGYRLTGCDIDSFGQRDGYICVAE